MFNHILMPDRKDLPFILSLLEDDSYEVRNEVLSALNAYGTQLQEDVKPFLSTLADGDLLILNGILQHYDEEEELAESWMEWLDIINPKQSLEYAMIQLSFLEYGAEAFLMGEDLDQLAESFEDRYPKGSVQDLMNFLFFEEKFRPPVEGTESHLHDNLTYVLKTRRGSQLMLTCMTILVGWRAGIDLDCISIQGNYMTMTFEGREMVVFNSYNKGKPLARASVMYIEEAFRRNNIPPQKIKSEVHEIVLQILKNTLADHPRNSLESNIEGYKEMYRLLLVELKSRNLLGT